MSGGGDDDWCAGEKPFKCDVCDYRSYKKSIVKNHMKSHYEGEPKPYQCPHCSYQARREYQLEEHVYSHTGERPFACELCDYRSAHRCNITRHALQEHPGAPQYVRWVVACAVLQLSHAAAVSRC